MSSSAVCTTYYAVRCRDSASAHALDDASLRSILSSGCRRQAITCLKCVVRNPSKWTQSRLAQAKLSMSTSNLPAFVDSILDTDENLFDAVIGDPKHVLHNLFPNLAVGSQYYKLRQRRHKSPLRSRTGPLTDNTTHALYGHTLGLWVTFSHAAFCQPYCHSWTNMYVRYWSRVRHIFMSKRCFCCHPVSVRPSVHLSRWCIVSRRLKISSNFLVGPVPRISF